MTRALARDIAALGVEDAQHEAMALHAVDALGALSAGLATREGRAVAEIFESADAASGVAAMSAIIRYTECDDIHVPTCMTAGAVVVPVAGEFAADAEAFAQAMDAGYGVGLALARSVGGVKALAHGVWPALFAAPAVAAATAAVAMRFDERGIAAAIGLAMAGWSGRAGRPSGMPSGRWIVFGEAVRKGVAAALAVRRGAAGDPDLMNNGWLDAQAPAGLAAPEHLEALPQGALAAFGLKPFVAARQGSNAIAAFRALLAGGLTPAEITSVEVGLPPETLGVVTRPLDPADRLSTIAHLGLQLGIAAQEPGRLLDVARDRAFAAETLEFARRVTVTADETLAGSDGWAARVRVETAGGAREEICAVLPGDPRDGDRRAMLAAKLKGLQAPPSLAELVNWETGGWTSFVKSQMRAQARLKASLGTAGHQARLWEPA